MQVSFVNSGSGEQGGEKIAFNYGRELFVYPYRCRGEGFVTNLIKNP